MARPLTEASGPGPDAGGPLLTLRGVRKAFGAVPALQGADLEVAGGEVHALVGENGAGKSTLLAILGGALSPDAGELRFAGRPYLPASPRAARDAGLALIHQELALAPHLSVEANITLGRERRRCGLLRPQTARVREILAALGSDLDPAARVGRLSLAERQIVEIARALFLEARLILMDEPTSSLSRRDVDRLFQVMGGLRARGVAVVYISHFLDEVRRVADRITVLRDGRTAAAGRPASWPTPEVLQAMAGRPVTEVFPRRARPGAAAGSAGVAVEKALELRAWVARAGAAPVSLSLRRGQILGLAGLMGSGRSALLRSLFGLRRGLSGEMEIGGARLKPADLSPERARAAGLGFLSEDRQEGLALGLSLRANLTLPGLRRYARSRLPGWLDLAREARAAADLCADLRLRCRDVEQRAGELSGGNQQKAALGRLFLDGAGVLLLDEPTRGVDVGAKAEIYRLVTDWAARGKTVIWAGSYLPELFGICDSLAVLHKGRISPCRPVEEWTEARVMAWAVSGLDPQGTGEPQHG